MLPNASKRGGGGVNQVERHEDRRVEGGGGRGEGGVTGTVEASHVVQRMHDLYAPGKTMLSRPFKEPCLLACIFKIALLP